MGRPSTQDTPNLKQIRLRVAQLEDADAIAQLVNRAFQVERFFIEGERTNPGAVRELLGKGKFLLAEQAGALAGCVYLEAHGVAIISSCWRWSRGGRVRGWAHC